MEGIHIEVYNASVAQKISERHNVCSAYSVDMSRCLLGNARVMMSIVYAAAWAYLPANGIDRHAACRMVWSPLVSGVDGAY
jgi:hypothetical protein